MMQFSGAIGGPQADPWGGSWQGPQPAAPLAAPTAPQSAPAQWVLTQEPAGYPVPGPANTAMTLTQPAVGWRRNRALSYFVRLSGASPTVDVRIRIRSGAQVIWNDVFPAGAAIGASINPDFVQPLNGFFGDPLSISIDAGGLNVQFTINMQGDTV